MLPIYRCNQGEGQQLRDSSPAQKDSFLNGTQWLSSSLELSKIN